MNTKKLLSVGAVAMLVLMALMVMAPTATADKHSEQGNLSRTFNWYGWFDFQTNDDAPGIGWFDPSDRDNNCVIRVFGADIGSGFYYDTLRIQAGDLQEVKEDVVVPELFLPVECPFAGADPGSNPGWTEFHIKAGAGIAQSHLMCLDTFADCVPKDDTAQWTLVVCKEDAEFSQDGDLVAALTGIAGPVNTGSQEIVQCDSNGQGGEPNIFDASDFLRPENPQTSRPIFVDWLAGRDKDDKKDPESHYIISCYEIGYTKEGVQELAQSHDWFLNLKAGTDPVGGANALLNHFDSNLQGLYDLIGDNECPHKEGNFKVVEKK